MQVKQDAKYVSFNLPVYDVDRQLSFLTSLCEDVEFPNSLTFVGLVLADWICKFQTRSKEISFYKAFTEFLGTAQDTHKKLCEYADHVAEVLNEQAD